MPRIGVYRSLLLLTGIYSNLLDPFDRKELIFSFFLIRFQIPSCEKQMTTLRSLKGVCCSVDLDLEYCIN
jgi:hypothetical protein